GLMKKKAPARPKPSSSRSKNKKASMTQSRRVVRMPQAQPKPSFIQDPRYQHTAQRYDAGLRALQELRCEKAKALFEKGVTVPSKELADRATVHLNICNQNLSRSSTTFKSPEEHYDYAVSLTNRGDYEGARSHLDKLQKQYPKADYVL